MTKKRLAELAELVPAAVDKLHGAGPASRKALLDILAAHKVLHNLGHGDEAQVVVEGQQARLDALRKGKTHWQD